MGTFYKRAANPNAQSYEPLPAQADLFEVGDFVAIAGPSFATAGERGQLRRFTSNTAGLIPVGIVQSSGLPVTQGVSGGKIPVYIAPAILEDATVAGLAGDRTDVGKPVYATAHNVLTLTAPTTGNRSLLVGHVESYRSSSVATISVLGRTEWLALYGESGEIPAAS